MLTCQAECCEKFSTEIDVFFFCSQNLIDLFRSSNALLSFSDFN